MVRGILLIAALMGAAFVYAGLDAEAGIRPLLQVRRNVGESRERIAAIRAELAVLRDEAAALVGDEFAIERAIREDLEFAKPGERVVRFARDDGTNPRFP